MPKLLFNCDQVFDVLTRGPFPAGEPSDDAVEQHLRACHDCRCLAEALRPAVALLHEAIASDDACGLPEYQGALAERRSPGRNMLSPRPLPRGMRQLSHSPMISRPRPQADNLLKLVRLTAAAMLVVALGILVYGFSAAPTSSPAMPLAQRPAFAEPLAEPEPTADGLLRLASLRLPAACLPNEHRPRSPQHAALLIAALQNGTLANLHCCTECHHATAALHSAALRSAVAITALTEHCRTCHRS